MAQEVSAGRPCEVCRSMQRQVIEEAIYCGERVSQISQRFTVSSHSLYRHIRNHSTPELKEAFHATVNVNAMSIISRVADIADSARDVRLRADTDELALKAGATELRTLETIATRMGIDHESTIQIVKEAKELARAVGEVARNKPEVAEKIVEALSMAGNDSMAEALAAYLGR